ncbi:universal stress protein [Salinirubellus salinus]|jgi:nucleotide-binding universal stress UspA family protein|uniref:Universal stress protein n=1 Tax=Salinirubellus salinus TaxID=1364945 RepID=A0A9E7R1V1_9EURY|nr:universal stress protein [Salinirubellus salinus]UWM53679.1 universal stress protein [Salinirubellus salinus]
MKVLLGVGGSDDGLTALDRTIERTREAGDDLTVAVVENPAVDRSTESIREAVEERLREAGLEAEVVVVEGHPGSRLVELAEREGFDRIVLGGGETSPLGKVSLGSIAEFVVLNATVSVTLVR